MSVRLGVVTGVVCIIGIATAMAYLLPGRPSSSIEGLVSIEIEKGSDRPEKSQSGTEEESLAREMPVQMEPTRDTAEERDFENVGKEIELLRAKLFSLDHHQEWASIINQLVVLDSPQAFDTIVDFIYRSEPWQEAGKFDLTAFYSKTGFMRPLWKSKDPRAPVFLRSLLQRDEADKLVRGWEKHAVPALFNRQREEIVAAVQAHSAGTLVLMQQEQDLMVVEDMFDDSKQAASVVLNRGGKDYTTMPPEDQYAISLYNGMADVMAMRDLLNELGGPERLVEASKNRPAYQNAIFQHLQKYSLYAQGR